MKLKKRCFAMLSALALLISAILRPVQAEDAAIDRLDDLLRTNQVLNLARVLQGGSINATKKLEWLKRRSAEGYVIAQYEIANQLKDQNRAEAIEWYAKARLGRILDASECKDGRRSEELGLLIDVGYQSLQELADKNEGLYADAIEKALRAEAGRTPRIPPYWICAPGNEKADEASLLPVEERRKKREAARSFLVTRGQTRMLEARLNANLNPNGFEIREIAEGLRQDQGPRSMAWVDEDILLFGAYEKTEKRTLYSWNAKTGDIKKIADNAVSPCTYRGFISYIVIRGDVRFRREGKLGEEVEIVEPRPLHPNYVVFRCRLIPKAEWSHEWPELPLEAGGVLKFPSKGEDRSAVRMKFYPEGKKTAIDLPFYSTQMLSASTQYSEYLGAHWITRHTGLKSETEPGRIWVIYPDGRVDTIDIPAGPWASLLGNYPAKDGWILRNHNGVYFWSTGEVRKVLRGLADDAAISPSGCRVAVKIRTPNAAVGFGFQMVDLCNRGDGK